MGTHLEETLAKLTGAQSKALSQADPLDAADEINAELSPRTEGVHDGKTLTKMFQDVTRNQPDRGRTFAAFTSKDGFLISEHGHVLPPRESVGKQLTALAKKRPADTGETFAVAFAETKKGERAVRALHSRIMNRPRGLAGHWYASADSVRGKPGPPQGGVLSSRRRGTLTRAVTPVWVVAVPGSAPSSR